MMNKLKPFIQSVLAIRFIRNIIRCWGLFISGIFSSNRLLSILYHIVLFFPHSREQQVVLRGQYRYLKNESVPSKSKVDLRRNIHRLEKGLLMRPRKPVFALNYIDEVVKSFESQVNAQEASRDITNSDELYWARDVLNEYFEVVERNDSIKRLYQKYIEIKKLIPGPEESNTKKVPYHVSRSTEPPVTYDSLLSLSHQRKSVRWFEDRAVPRALIDQALLVARESPSACNRQPFHYRIYDDKKLVERVASIPFGSAGYSHNIPVVVVLTGNLSFYFSTRDRHVIYIDASLSAMGFMYALETLGLSSCVINWPDFEPLEMKMKQELGLKLEERPIMLIAVGYPDLEGKVAFSQKKPLDLIRSYNQI